MSVKISVQICSYNRWSLLKRALEALFVQDFPKDHYEIVFVDDGSTDETFALATEIAKTAPCRLKVLTKKKRRSAPGPQCWHPRLRRRDHSVHG